MSEFELLFSYYTEKCIKNYEKYARKELRLKMPKLPLLVLKELLLKSAEIFKDEDTVVKVYGNCVVIGDIHGQILDLFRVINKFGIPPTIKYVFLGDLVDRGEFSLEVLTFVLIMKILFPNDVYVLRGNHEVVCPYNKESFIGKVMEQYGTHVVAGWIDKAFSYMPFGAIINDESLCIHGGIGPNVRSIDDIMSISRPNHSFPDNVSQEVVWSDPSSQISFFMPSPRGVGYLYGSTALSRFLKASKLKEIVRGHQCVDEGVCISLHQRCITVFSASRYTGCYENLAGAVLFEKDTSYTVYKLCPLQWLQRKDAMIVDKNGEHEQNTQIKQSCSMQSLAGQLEVNQSRQKHSMIRAPQIQKTNSSLSFHSFQVVFNK